MTCRDRLGRRAAVLITALTAALSAGVVGTAGPARAASVSPPSTATAEATDPEVTDLTLLPGQRIKPDPSKWGSQEDAPLTPARADCTPQEGTSCPDPSKWGQPPAS